MGNRFKWSKHFEDGHSIWEQLDQGLANDAWFLKIPGSIVQHLQSISSDHYLLLINLLGLDPPPKKRVFRFEEMWLSDERCTEMVEASWSSYSVGHRDSDILKRVEILWQGPSMVEPQHFWQCEEGINKQKSSLGEGRICCYCKWAKWSG